MNLFRPLTPVIPGVALAFIFGSTGIGQVVINEIVDDERTAGSGQVNPDTREFVELYNAGDSTVDIGGWTLSTWELGAVLGGGSYFFTDEIPAGTMLTPNDYYVIGPAEVPNVDLVLPSDTDLFPDLNTVFELRDGPVDTGTLIDAVGIETFRSQELANALPEQLPQLGRGWWGQMISNNAIAPNVPQSLARYLDGRDTDNNGRDFGALPITPGTSNNLPQTPSHTIADVDGMAVGSALSSDYYASFLLSRVVNPTAVSGINPNAISESPQGGNAIMAWDESGGGNAAYSNSYVNEFELYAYIDTEDLAAATVDEPIQSEATIYGIGTTDPFFATPDSAGLLGFASAANGSTGLGWLIQRVENFNDGDPTTTTVLQLIDMKGSGESVPTSETLDWEVKESFTLTTDDTGWHVLGIEYDPETGDVSAAYDEQTFNFMTETGLVGNFYVGYRENLPGAGGTTARPPTYDLFVPDDGLIGDYNNDGEVDAADYTVWRDSVGAEMLLNRDPNNVGAVGEDDYNAWVAHFGMTIGSGSIAAVPEMSSIAQTVMAFLALAAFSWRRCRS